MLKLPKDKIFKYLKCLEEEQIKRLLENESLNECSCFEYFSHIPIKQLREKFIDNHIDEYCTRLSGLENKKLILDSIAQNLSRGSHLAQKISNFYAAHRWRYPDKLSDDEKIKQDDSQKNSISEDGIKNIVDVLHFLNNESYERKKKVASFRRSPFFFVLIKWRERWDSNPRPSP